MMHKTYWQTIWLKFQKRPLGMIGLVLLALFVLMALYAPFLASSKPIVVVYDGDIYFPLFRYLLSSSVYSKKIDIFFNLLGLFAPFLIFIKRARGLLFVLLLSLFVLFGFFVTLDPANSVYLNKQKAALMMKLSQDDKLRLRPRKILPSWDIDLDYMNAYAKLNLVLSAYTKKLSHESKVKALGFPKEMPSTRYWEDFTREKKQALRLERKLKEENEAYTASRKEENALRMHGGDKEKLFELEEKNEAYEEMQNRYRFILDKRLWLERQEKKISFIIMPLIRIHHWEDDVGGEQALNLKFNFFEDTRLNGKDLVASLIFGSRISLFVGLFATLLALAIGVPLGLVSGYYGSKLDMLLCRIVEVWEAMPVFFMLLLVVSILQTKSIFIIILVISIFSWMRSFRFIRAETFRQRKMLYVDASKAIGFPDRFILIRHILPNSILAVLALLPFDIMAAVTQEAALAFLGLGEEQSCSWGVLMDEGRAAFPADSALLWPPAIILTVLLIAIAFVGQSLQGAMDPKAQD